MPRHNSFASLQSDKTTPKFKHLQSQLLTNQRLPYTSGGSARGVASNTGLPLVGATVFGDGSDKLGTESVSLPDSQSVSQSLSLLVGRPGSVLDFSYSDPQCADWMDRTD